MPARSNSPNHFLASLSPEDYALIQPHLRPIELPQGLVLYVADEGIERVYFPHNGVISLVVGLVDGRFVEAGMFGRNGVVGGGAAHPRGDLFDKRRRLMSEWARYRNRCRRPIT